MLEKTNIDESIGAEGIAGIDVLSGIKDNLDNGADGSKIVSDVIVDTARNAGGMAFGVGAAKVGAALGTAIPIPGIGIAVGAVTGCAVGYLGSKLYTKVTDEWKFGKKKQTLSEVVSGGINNAINWGLELFD